jgi:hypothetical protein
VSEPGQPQRLRALSRADVKHPQTTPGMRAGRLRVGAPPRPKVLGEWDELFIELARDQLLSDGVPQAAEAREPAGRPAGESFVPQVPVPGAQSLAPRPTCGFGSRRRRIWSVRISP